MRKTLIGIIATLAVVVVGCGTVGKALYTQTPATQDYNVTQPVFGLVTNNGVVGIGQVGTTNLTVTASNATWQLSPKANAALETGKALTPLLPPGVDVAAYGILSALGVGLGAFARYKSGQTTLSNAALTAVVAGVEQFNNPGLKQSIQTLATANGSQDHLDGVVQGVSKALPQNKSS